MSKYKIALDKAIRLTSTNRGLRNVDDMVATFEQKGKDVNIFDQRDIFKLMQ